MNLKEKLSQRIGINEIYEITYFTQQNPKGKQELFDLLFDSDDVVAYQSAWVFCHFSLYENEWLYDKQDELIDEVLICQHPGKRRLLLSMLYRQTFANPPRTDFLDFCLERMASKDELPGVKTLCMKLAYELCRPIPELLREFRLSLEIMAPYLDKQSTKTVYKNLLKKMKVKNGE